MGKIILVIGGARSGKSSFAEAKLRDKDSVCYLATSVVDPMDTEMIDRVKKHQKQRPNIWHTEERYQNIGGFLSENKEYDGYLLDCATTLSMNYFYGMMIEKYGKNYELIDDKIAHFTEEEKDEVEAQITKEWQTILEAAKELKGDIYIVANEVGLGIVPENSFTRWFRDVYGRVNQLLGKEADQVYLVVAGIPVTIK
ncbi:bifunctional adenosylcobinamide kinase/adenosylcobinamide-phosphate guanylyltransferase [Vagococcus hydrophili]|uniref:Adenosylcobinamide kinase n=1 Tax=Vagococcus hydrophili TaxID=2714947 RepID=A0A6G8AUC8_9ENTE|nr:bifunctional adenosylcobinamide kinase/adenosylcobinamide-phosphate guanylyltransferase [Vagococcus hydrophili]QIL48664.1 bifunctional adenosylcobinamide kinase/adenosylcobinamide-phosphate guanylyltransferase [Vagococcus hydrophili]